jgi:uncharacterized protein with HEPN domain
MNLEVQKYLYDIQSSIESIYSYLGDKRDFNDYLSNKLLRRGIERELEIIGEAANRILKIEPTIPIDNARKIVDLRNWVIHGYDKVDDVIVWGIVTNHLPKLLEQVVQLSNQ